jgi:3-deoxy-D-manno-octulosonic-acid transferase
LIFVQDSSSEELLKKFHFERVVVAGDTRVDAVMRRDASVRPDKTQNRRVIIGGSTWPVEEQMLAKLWKLPEFKELKVDWSLVIAPHDISEQHLVQIETLFPGEIVRHSRIEGPWQETLNQYGVILIDSIGHLSSLYAQADVAFIGGGFGKGIHNILEPSAYGVPVIFGPNYSKFGEAVSLFDIGAAFPVKDFDSFVSVVKKMCTDSVFRAESGNLALSYMKSQMGSSDLIIRYLLE